MYKKLSASSGNALGYEITDQINEEEYQKLVAELEGAIAQYGGIRLLVSMPKLPATEWSVVDDDFRFSLRHMDDIERLAVVGDTELVKWVARISGTLISPQVEYFEPAQIDEAWRWIRA